MWDIPINNGSERFNKKLNLGGKKCSRSVYWWALHAWLTGATWRNSLPVSTFSQHGRITFHFCDWALTLSLQSLQSTWWRIQHISCASSSTCRVTTSTTANKSVFGPQICAGRASAAVLPVILPDTLWFCHTHASSGFMLSDTISSCEVPVTEQSRLALTGLKFGFSGASERHAAKTDGSEGV